jgi:hypothetical protein
MSSRAWAAFAANSQPEAMTLNQESITAVEERSVAQAFRPAARQT